MKRSIPNTKRRKLTVTPSPAPTNSDCQEFIAALEELKQPCNWVVQAFIRLLQLDGAKNRWAPQLLNYTYGQTPLQDGHWFLPKLKTAQHGPVPLGIVHTNVFEVSIRDSWMQGAVAKQRLIPVAMLGPGALFGAFEFCDLRASVSSLRNYEVSAGSRAFKIVPKRGDSIRTSTGAFFKSLKNSNRCEAWREGRADHDELIRYYELDGSWKATILLLTQTPLNLTPKERDLIDVFQNEAWRQSRHLREGHLKWLRHDLNPQEFSVRTVALAAASKFKRKVELALAEECLVFGNPTKLEEYGPCSSLLEKINGELANREQLQQYDVLAPLLVHDTGSPSYLSLSEDALVFGTSGDFTQIQKATKTIAESLQSAAKLSCDISLATQKGGRADEFWRGAIQLKPRFPNLPCLKAIRDLADKNVFDGSAVAIAQHLLEETGSMIQSLIEIGGQGLPSRIFVIGKPYSSNFRVWQRISNLGVNVEDLFFAWKPGEFDGAYRGACKKLWSSVSTHLSKNTDIKRVLILDDGGMLFQTVPSQLVNSHVVVGVEQTSKGLPVAAKSAFPVVGVACSAAKKRLEPSIVAETIWQKLEMILPQACAAKTMAVCGLGNVGERLTEFIIDRFKLRETGGNSSGRKLLVFDRNKKVMNGFHTRGSVIRASGLAEAFEESEVIFGCTGTDLTEDIVDKLDGIKNGKTRYLVSCSSFDIEFASLLKKSELNPNLSPFDLAQYINPKGTFFLIPQAGFPITFDRAPASAPIEQMQMTRGLLLAGLLQAASLAANERRPKGLISLDTQMQIAVVKAWREAKVRDESWLSDYWFGKLDEVQSVERASLPPKTSA